MTAESASAKRHKNLSLSRWRIMGKKNWRRAQKGLA
jgi:hypothetical protein